MASITDGLGLPVSLLLSSWPSWLLVREGVVLVADLDRLLYRPGELGLVPLRGVGGDGEPQVGLLIVVVLHIAQWYYNTICAYFRLVYV